MKLHKGQMLVEILVAVGVAVVALLAVFKISSRSIVNVNSAIKQSQASSYAQTAIDKMKELKATLGLAGAADTRFAHGAVWCFDGTNINTVITDFCTIGTTEYSGKVTMNQQTINNKVELGVVAEIRWIEGSLTRTVKNEAKLIFDQ